MGCYNRGAYNLGGYNLGAYSQENCNLGGYNLGAYMSGGVFEKLEFGIVALHRIQFFRHWRPLIATKGLTVLYSAQRKTSEYILFEKVPNLKYD